MSFCYYFTFVSVDEYVINFGQRNHARPIWRNGASYDCTMYGYRPI